MATRIREKAKLRKENKDNRPYALAKFVRMSPSKVRIVLDNIRGLKATDAVAVLSNTSKIAAEPILKVLNSAIANAENNKGLSKDDLLVAECFACPGPILKRHKFASRGRVHKILKRTSHITIVLDLVK